MEQIETRGNLIVEYCLLTFVILWSGGYATYGIFANWQYVLFIISLYILIKRNYEIEWRNYYAIAVFAIIAICQALVFSGPLTSIVEPITRLLAIAMVAVIVRPYFNHVFISITTIFAFFSLVFWGIDVAPGGHSFLLSVAKGLPQFGADLLTEQNYDHYGYVNYSLYFYSVSDRPIDTIDFIIRNAGPFFEPGRFTIILTISLALILFSGEYKRYKIAFYIILIANCTTLSTTGYLSMIILFGGYYWGKTEPANLSGVILFYVLIIGSYFVMGFSFMGEKISIALDSMDTADSRFGAMFYHWGQIQDSPWIGFGPFLKSVFLSLETSPCGITDMMRKWGIPIFLMCIWLLYKGTRAVIIDGLIFRITFVIMLLVLAYTQTIMNAPLYYLLYFIGSEVFVYDNEEAVDDELIEEDIDDELNEERDIYAERIDTTEI